MANQKFLERMKSAVSNLESNNPPSSITDEYEEDSEVMDSFGKEFFSGDRSEELKQMEEIQSMSNKSDPVVESKNVSEILGLDEDSLNDIELPAVENSIFKNYVDSEPIMTDGDGDEVSSSTLQTEELSVECKNDAEEKAAPRRRRGRPKMEDAPALKEKSVESKMESKINVEDSMDVKSDIVDGNDSIANEDLNDDSLNERMDTPVECIHVSDMVLNYVCHQTINYLLNSYQSEMYTEKFMQKLLNDYLENSIDASNPLFKELIIEVIGEVERGKLQDPYLKDLTLDVLKFIVK